MLARSISSSSRFFLLRRNSPHAPRQRHRSSCRCWSCERPTGSDCRTTRGTSASRPSMTRAVPVLGPWGCSRGSRDKDKPVLRLLVLHDDAERRVRVHKRRRAGARDADAEVPGLSGNIPPTTDARWGHFKPSRRGQCEPSFSHATEIGSRSREVHSLHEKTRIARSAASAQEPGWCRQPSGSSARAA